MRVKTEEIVHCVIGMPNPARRAALLSAACVGGTISGYLGSGHSIEWMVGLLALLAGISTLWSP